MAEDINLDTISEELEIDETFASEFEEDEDADLDAISEDLEIDETVASEFEEFEEDEDEDVDLDAISEDLEIDETFEEDEHSAENVQQQQMTLEEAQQVALIQVNNAIFFSQFQEIRDFLEQRIKENLVDNARYTEALEQFVHFVANIVCMKASPIEVAEGQPLISRYKCGVNECAAEQPDFESCAIEDDKEVNCAPKPTP